MLHLKPGVHLEEVEALLFVDQELHGSRAGVIHGPGRFDRGPAHRLAGLLADEGRGGLLDDLLVAALDGAFPLEQVNHVTVVVGQHLNLHVPGLRDVTLGVDGVVAKSGAGQGPGPVERRGQLPFLQDHPHSLAAAARRRL